MSVLAARLERKIKARKYFHRIDKDGNLVKDKHGNLVPADKDHESKTIQNLPFPTDINQIVSRYRETGILGSPQNASNMQPLFVDISGITNLQDAQNKVIAAREAFESLPAKVRNRFQNNPQAFVDFMGNPENKEEAIRLGLIKKAAAKVSDTPKEAFLNKDKHLEKDLNKDPKKSESAKQSGADSQT